MDLKNLEAFINKPPLYEKGNSVMWTDKHISKKLLEIHLDLGIDLASRSQQNINITIEFILKHLNNSKIKILDLGCGPGLYAEQLAAAGHSVTGVDFSESSIEYASKQAKIKKLDIDYICEDYLAIEFKEKFDLVLLVYTDLGVLIPSEREKLLSNIHKALKPGGIFFFDVINDKNIEQKFPENKTWTYEAKGFWKDAPYLELTNGIHYRKEKVFLQQHIIIDQEGTIKTYRFWTHYFGNDDMIKILKKNGFTNMEGFDDVLPGTNIWSGDNINFYVAKKHGTPPVSE